MTRPYLVPQMTGPEDGIIPAKAATKLAGHIPGNATDRCMTDAGMCCASRHSTVPLVRAGAGLCQSRCVRLALHIQLCSLPCPHPSSRTGAWLVQYPGTGHGFVWERMDEVLAAVELFLSSLEDPSDPEKQVDG